MPLFACITATFWSNKAFYRNNQTALLAEDHKYRECTDLTACTGQSIRPGQQWCPFTAGTDVDSQITEIKELTPTSAETPFSLIRPDLFQVGLAQTCFTVLTDK